MTVTLMKIVCDIALLLADGVIQQAKVSMYVLTEDFECDVHSEAHRRLSVDSSACMGAQHPRDVCDVLCRRLHPHDYETTSITYTST